MSFGVWNLSEFRDGRAGVVASGHSCWVVQTVLLLDVSAGALVTS